MVRSQEESNGLANDKLQVCIEDSTLKGIIHIVINGNVIYKGEVDKNPEGT